MSGSIQVNSSRHGCMSDASLRSLIQCLSDVSKRTDRAASVPRLPSTTIDSSVNALKSSYVATTKPMSFKTRKLVLFSLTKET